jgi:hypothetical protein
LHLIAFSMLSSAAVLTKLRHIVHSGHMDNHHQSHNVSGSCTMNVNFHCRSKRS